MNNITLKILSNYDKNTKILDISNKEIVGILCLKNFKNLEELNCSFNKITEIYYLPTSLKYLDCSNNKIVNNLLFELYQSIDTQEIMSTEIIYGTHTKFTNNFFGCNLPNTLTYL